MKVTFLGTGTSQGVPVINCDCPVCRSDNPKNTRLRSSIMIEVEGLHILIDTATDMRQQFLKFPFPRIDAVLYTHSHADHIFGIDEIRRFNYIQKEVVPVYGDEQTIERIRFTFPYAISKGDLKPGVPNISVCTINGRLNLAGTEIISIPLMHGDITVLGYRVNNFAYCTDVNAIPPESYEKLAGLDVLALGALREKKHPKHFSLEEAIFEAEKIGARKTYFTHISHILDHEKHGRLLPESCAFAYDGLQIDL